MNRLLAGISGALLLLAHPCFSAPEGTAAEIKAAIDESLSRHGKISDEDRYAPVMKFGADAVPGVIERYGQVTGREREEIAKLLCYLGTPDARKFLKQIVGEKETTKEVMDKIFTFYPKDHFDEILSEAVQVVGAGIPCFFAGERAKEAVRRYPKLAGAIVAALKEQPPDKHSNFRVGSLLAEVTGWSAWQFDAQKENESNSDLGDTTFWRKWWNRNKDRTLFDWLVEAYRAHPKSASQKASALQYMSLLNDPRLAPIYFEALDDADEGVRYWSVCGFKKLEGDNGGYTFEQFKTEQGAMIGRLKKDWSAK